MDERIKFFVGLDAHKDSISVAACETGREPARFIGTMSPDVNGLLELLAKAGDPASVSVVYEAGPTGYGLHRELCRRGYPRPKGGAVLAAGRARGPGAPSPPGPSPTACERTGPPQGFATPGFARP
jgi:hypothetical protein